MTHMDETFSDNLLGFTLPQRHVRGRAIRLDNTLDRILSAHDYPPAIQLLLADALVLTALMGALVKQDGSQLTMQAQTRQGVVRLLVCDYRDGALRGYVDFDREGLARLGANPQLTELFGDGYLAVTFDHFENEQKYQGIVPLDGATLGEACEKYFQQSEQIPTLIRTAIRSDDTGCMAGGLLVQHLADGEEGKARLDARADSSDWEHVAILAGSIRHEELLDPSLSMEALIWRLFHEEEEVRVRPGRQVSRGCRCDVAHYQAILAGFPETDRVEMRDSDGLIRVDCSFCAKQFAIDV